MEPELFRLNINQFLQTARTVTFLVQKDKANIPAFHDIYAPAVAQWASDEVMCWAVDSRNRIEKEGDLDLYSTLELTLLYSYISEQDRKLVTGRSELLMAGTKKLVRFARKHLPSGVLNAASIKIERVWIANTLPKTELLQACDYIYTSHFMLCRSLAESLQLKLSNWAMDPTDLLGERDSARQVRYLRLSDMSSRRSRHTRAYKDPDFVPPPDFPAADLQARFARANTTDDKFAILAELAEITFTRDGYHIPMLHLFDSELRVTDLVSTEFADQGDKFIFWRDVADRIVSTRAFAVSFVSEAWIRDMRSADKSSKISSLPIIGEQLVLDVLDRTGKFLSAIWTIVRVDGQPPTLRRTAQSEADKRADTAFVYAPVLRAFGLPYPPAFGDPASTVGGKRAKEKKR